MDLTTRVTALEARDGGTEPYEILRSSLVLGLEGSDDTLTAGAADEELTFVLAVEVDEDIPLREPGCRPLAPTIPTSSSTVKRASRGPCLRVSSERTAII